MCDVCNTSLDSLWFNDKVFMLHSMLLPSMALFALLCISLFFCILRAGTLVILHFGMFRLKQFRWNILNRGEGGGCFYFTIYQSRNQAFSIMWMEWIHRTNRRYNRNIMVDMQNIKLQCVFTKRQKKLKNMVYYLWGIKANRWWAYSQWAYPAVPSFSTRFWSVFTITHQPRQR